MFLYIGTVSVLILFVIAASVMIYAKIWEATRNWPEKKIRHFLWIVKEILKDIPALFREFITSTNDTNGWSQDAEEAWNNEPRTTSRGW